MRRSRIFPAGISRLCPPGRPAESCGRWDKADGMYHLNGFLLIGGGSLTYIPDSGEAPVVRSGVLREGKKSLVGIGTRVLIFPDKMAFDTADGTLKALGAVWSGSASVEITPCDAEGKTYTVNRWGLEEPEDPADGEVFLKVTAESSPWNADGGAGSLQQLAGTVDRRDAGLLQDQRRGHRGGVCGVGHGDGEGDGGGRGRYVR